MLHFLVLSKFILKYLNKAKFVWYNKQKYFRLSSARLIFDKVILNSIRRMSVFAGR